MCFFFYTCSLQARGKNSVLTDCIIPNNKIGENTRDQPNPVRYREDLVIYGADPIISTSFGNHSTYECYSLSF